LFPFFLVSFSTENEAGRKGERSNACGEIRSWFRFEGEEADGEGEPRMARKRNAQKRFIKKTN
jgi:hypothetical protein